MICGIPTRSRIPERDMSFVVTRPCAGGEEWLATARDKAGITRRARRRRTSLRDYLPDG